MVEELLSMADEIGAQICQCCGGKTWGPPAAPPRRHGTPSSWSAPGGDDRPIRVDRFRRAPLS